jgi:predicted Fe-S protein YdhL (DUF1289 family)
MKLTGFGQGREPTVTEVPCARCKATTPVTQTLLDIVATVNGIQAHRGEQPLAGFALCDACHVERRRYFEARGCERHDLEQAAWNEYRRGQRTEASLLDLVADKAGFKTLIERRKVFLEEKQKRKTKPSKSSAVYGGNE